MRATRVGSIEERFASRYRVDPATGCWNWTGRKNAKGYGVIAGELKGKRYVPKGQSMLAHRASWIITHGEIPEAATAHGTIVLHTCDNASCVNPNHLRLGSQRDNVLDMIQKGRRIVSAKSGIEHGRSAFKNQSDIDLICATKGKTKELAERFGVDTSAIKRIRARNGVGNDSPDKFKANKLSLEAIAHIRSTSMSARALARHYGVSATAISNIRKGLTYKSVPSD